MNRANLNICRKCLKKLYPKGTEFFYSASLSACLILLNLGLKQKVSSMNTYQARLKIVKKWLKGLIMTRLFLFSLYHLKPAAQGLTLRGQIMLFTMTHGGIPPLKIRQQTGLTVSVRQRKFLFTA